MESRRPKRIVLASCTLMIGAFLSGAHADEVQVPDVDFVLTEDGKLVEVGGGPIIGPSCLPSNTINCSILPVPVGGSCSCTSEVLERECKSCDPLYKGVVLETTCTIWPAPCTGPSCEIQSPTVVTHQSCVRTL